MICVIATFETIDGGRGELLKAFKELTPKVLAEKGCIDYMPMIDLTTSLPNQKPMRDNVLTLIEKWEDLEALETHLMAPHMIEFRRATGHLRVNVELQMLEPG
jgi:quinol monooxygenase YgiN